LSVRYLGTADTRPSLATTTFTVVLPRP